MKKTTHLVFKSLKAEIIFLVIAAIPIVFIGKYYVAKEVDDARQKKLDRIAYALTLHIETGTGILRGLQSLYKVLPNLTEKQFNLWTRDRLAGSSIAAISWAPNVASSHLKITERNEDGKLVPAIPRASYQPVTYIAPMFGNEAALGYDLQSDHVRHQAIKRSYYNRGSVVSVTTPIDLVQEEGSSKAVLLFLHVNEKDVVTAILRISSMMDEILSNYTLGDLRVSLVDSETRDYLYGDQNGAYEKSVKIGDRFWVLSLTEPSE